ncbi:MAG TPA: AAA family ATPase, partial [Acetobacteraceae bacterium]|nr:AAA family ATPase [Acetobacteraceae bacterium]
VGRERELSTLLAALGDLQRGNGRALAVVGQPGVGKSRLIHEFLGALPAGWRVLRAVAMPQSRGTPFHLVTEILRAWIGAGPSDHPERLARLVAAALAAQMAERPADAAAVRFLLDIDAGDGSWEEIEAAQRRRRVQEVLANILRGEAQRAPLIVVVEDLHWADPFSLAALDALALGPAGTPLMLLATTRPETRPAWSRQPHAALLLEPLSPANAEQLLHRLLGPAEGLAPLRAQILARAEGTPLFLEEITRSLIESGTVDEAVTANAAGATVAAVTIPASVHSILAARIDRLPPPRRRVLQIAAVTGRHISPRLIAAVSGHDEATLAEELRQLQLAEFVHATELPTGTQYVFKHALTQAEAYDSLLLSQRRTLHSRVLAAMQTLFADRLDWMAEELAGHALAGEVWPEAVRHALRAGERANRRSAWHPAISFLEHAIAALEHLPSEPSTIAQAIEARLQLRVAVVAIGDVPRMLTCLDEARDLTDATGDALGAALIDIRRCIGLSMLGEIEAAIPPGEAALAVARAAADAAGVVAASFALGQVHYISGDFRTARAVLQDSLEIARTTPLSRIAGGPGTPALLLMTCLARSLCALGDMEQARDLAEEALARAEQIHRSFDRAEAQQALGVIHLAAGRPAEAVAVLVPALDLARANEHWLLMPMIALALGPAYAATGSAAAGAVLLEEAIRRAAQHGLVAVGAQCRLALASLQAETSTAGLHSTVEDLLTLSRRHRLRALEAQACRLMARLHADEPAVACALLAAAEAVAEAGAPDTPDLAASPDGAASRPAVAGSPATVLVVQQ